VDSEERRRAIERLTMSGLLACPESLPIAARSAELVDAIRNHQVVIVAGETGSGKSTQLPKLCLAAGRGTNGMIGHTQPRRIAARSIAERVAHELNSDIGEDVGYAVRFTDKVGAHTLVKVMTDGIVLAETQRDRSLRRYDTIIVDEAHERSLNIDFLLGYLHQLLPQRPDLHLVITSATIDTQRFSEHFGDAPIITVEGRTYPVEIRYRPYGEDDDRDQVQAICDAVDELSDDIDGDVLVFLSGEREIHDTADALRRLERPHTEVLPLYARLSSVEQQRIFAPHRGRRIVLSTNVAETSLTVPGIRAVVDAGTARISRYSQRLKVQRLPIEPVSQASANQRSGRCGRVADGICIRLYDEEDFAGRPEFTEPEILRTSLASVILQMTALGLGEVEAFPFIEAPDPRSIRNGYLLLDELGAIRDGRLTKVGRQLARLPVDPRMARMVLEADRHGCVREVMVIAAALSIQDPREYPAEHRQHAEELHRRFRVAGSDFLSFVALWDYLRAQQQQLSGNQFRKLCRSEYLNYLRVREWQDLFSQLRQVAGQLGIRPGTAAGHPDRVHQALLAGLLSHLGHRDSTRADPKRPEYRGAHGSTFAIGRESAVGKNAQWVIAAELVETNRLWGRVVATVQPEWAERLGAHLVRYSYGDPEWDSRNGRAVIDERASLYGLPIVARRTIGYDRVDAADARQMFVRHALVEGDWRADYPFLASNTALLSHMRAIEERTRRFDGIDDDAVHAFYDARVPADIVSVRHFDRWWTRSSAEQRSVLTMTADALGRSAAADDADFPDTWRQGDLVLDLTYRFAPGETDDGVSVLIPLAVLHQVAPDGFDWQVPGYRHELATALAATLPKDIRRQLIPMADTVDAAVQRLTRLDGELLATSLARAITQVSRVSVAARDFDLSKVAEHLRITFVVHDRSGTVVGEGKDLGVLRRGLRQQLRAEVARLTPIEERTGITTWDLGTLPREIETERDGHTVVAYPTLVDTGEAVALRIVTSPAVRSKAMRSGLRRLLQLAVPVSRRTIESKLSNADKLVLVAAQRPALAGDCVHAAADAVLDVAGTDVWDEQAFAALIATAKSDMPDLAARALHGAATILTAAAAVETRLAALSAPSLAVSVGDARDHLARLLGPRFVSTVGVDRLDDLERAVRGIERRLAKLTEQPGRDAQRTRELRPLEERYERFRAALPVSAVTAEVIDIGWSLEELRISTFAQALGVKGSASSKRITARLAQLGG
jgi:ATP-dependent helicase HrpA